MMERDPLTKRFLRKTTASVPPQVDKVVPPDPDKPVVPPESDKEKEKTASPAAPPETTSTAAKSKWWEPVIGILILALLSGCSSFRIEQEEVSTDGTRRHTVTRGYALFDSKSDMSKVRATTTDKSQIQSIGALSQEASSQVVRIIVEGARPVP